MRLKKLRVKSGVSQTELAKLIGVTPSTISQIESNLIYPSLPALIKMTEILSIDISSLFQDSVDDESQIVFKESNAFKIKSAGLPERNIKVKRLIPLDFNHKVEPFLIEIQPGNTLSSHFFIHKGEEIGYLLSGELEMKMEKSTFDVNAGDVIYLTSEIPSQWKNPGQDVTRLLWIKIK